MTAVVAQHCGMLPFGWIGVWLFFVISGYVVTQSVIGREVDLPRFGRLLDFFRRRAARIVPVYYAYVIVGLGFGFATGLVIDVFDIASLLMFFHNVAMGQGRGLIADWPVGHLWTISVEMQFYLLYGTLLILAPRRTVVVFLFASLIATPLIRLLTSNWMVEIDLESVVRAYRIYSGSFLHTDVFAVGALLAFAKQGGVLGKIARPLAVAGGSLLAVYCAFYVWANYALVGARDLDVMRNVVSGIVLGQYREVFAYTAIAAASGGLLALAATADPFVEWLLRYRIIQRIGEISYGAYVFHALAIDISMRILPVQVGGTSLSASGSLALFVFSYAMTIAAAEISFRHFERRFMRGRSGSGNWTAQPRWMGSAQPHKQ